MKSRIGANTAFLNLVAGAIKRGAYFSGGCCSLAADMSLSLLNTFMMLLAVASAFRPTPKLAAVFALRDANPRPDALGGNNLTRIGFALTEAFAFLVGEKKKAVEPTQVSASLSPIEMATKIGEEYNQIFFLTGSMDTTLWEDDCTFADPFSSFGGPGSTARFKRNADALSALVSDAKIKVSSVDLTDNETVVKVAWSFSGTLKLPWRPVLAAAGETSHYLSPTSGRVFRYQERWKSKPFDVVKRLFVPGKAKAKAN